MRVSLVREGGEGGYVPVWWIEEDGDMRVFEKNRSRRRLGRKYRAAREQVPCQLKEVGRRR